MRLSLIYLYVTNGNQDPQEAVIGMAKKDDNMDTGII